MSSQSRMPDHPRSRGVYDPVQFELELSVGSSPLARGLPRPSLVPHPAAGIIPARAGFTHPGRRAATPGRDHPRSRGVYVMRTGLVCPLLWIIPARAGFTLTCRSPSSSSSGSSPLARGLPAAAGPVLARARIIPARAGFTPPWSRTAPGPAGSSPLARGLHRGPAGGRGRRRIIPARAGFTVLRHRQGPTQQDHPRSRGVYDTLTGTVVAEAGSSPLARGLLLLDASAVDGDGIIPARAGFTEVIWRDTEAKSGSSPLARGLRVHVDHHVVDVRIIPARAGFTRGRRGRWASTGDHPRSRGVYKVEAYFTRLSGGSSPLARGLHNRLQLLPRRRGIIPARAGFTGRRRRPP